MKDLALKNSSTTDLNQDQSHVPTSDFWLTMRTNVRLKQQTPPIQSFPRDGKLPLTLNQRRLWFLEQLQPGSSVQNLLHTFRFTGLLNIETLKQSINEIVHRHEILHTTFPIVNGQPVQHIAPNLTLYLPVIDLQYLPLEEREATAQELAFNNAEQPFDLISGPLWRFQLLCLAPDEHLLIRTVHHIIFDGWSHGVFLRELGVLYDAFSTGKPSPLPKLSIQYADFAQAQRQWFEAEMFVSQLDYWKQQFSNNVTALELPTDYPRSAMLTYQGGCKSLVLSEDLTVALKALSRQQGVTLFATLLAAFKILLYCYSQQDDMLVSSPIASRHHSETKGLIGYFNNLVLMRTNLSGNPTVLEFLSRVSQVTLEAYTNQDVPLQQLADLRSLAHTPLNRAMFTLQNIPNPTLNLEGLTVNSSYMERPIANFDLSLSMQENAGQLAGVLQYKTDLFDIATITQMLENFQTLLEQLVTTPEQYLADLPRFSTTKSQGSSASLTSKLPEPFVPPQDEIELQLINICKDVLGFSVLGIRDNLFAQGADSLLAVRLCDRIEQAFYKALPLVTMFQAPTVEQLALILRQEERSDSWSSLTPIQPKGSKPPLFLCEGVGIYYPLIPYLRLEQPIYGLVAGSQEGKPIQYKCLEDLAALYIAEMQTLQPKGPYFLGGISWGGVVAFEIAQQLVSQGHEVALLAFFDTIRPGAYKPNPIGVRIMWHLKNLLRNGPAYGLEKVSGQLQKRLSLQQFKSLSNTNRKFFPENQMMPVPQNEEHFAMRQAFNQACRNYTPKAYPGRVAIFAAKDRQDAGAYQLDSSLGWDALATGGIEIYHVPGDHLGILKEPDVQVLGEKLRESLEQAQIAILKH
jgi:thioesterase domain-containing protein/NRPS condensation-like uncharacterized protein/acyl carrier protein